MSSIAQTTSVGRQPPSRSLTLTAIFLAVAMAATVGTALGFEHFGGYMPCKLCLEQRIPYYIGVPLMAVAVAASLAGAPRWLVRVLLAAGGGLMLWGLYMGVFHSGVEWHWWAGPTDCGAVSAPAEEGRSVLDMLDDVIPPSCDAATLRVLGLSFAGWNAVASLVLAAVAFRGALKR